MESAIVIAARDQKQSKSPAAKTARKAESSPARKEAPEFNPYWQSLALNTSGIQCKLSVSQPDDPDEREADRVADKVMRMATPAASSFKIAPSATDPPKVKRKANHHEEEEEEQKLRAEHPPGDSRLLKGPGQPLDRATRRFFEPRFGHDFSQVRIHTDQDAIRQAEKFQAHAFTLGSNIAFNLDRFQPKSPTGQRLLAHELTHVVQQQNRASFSTQSRIQRDSFQRITAEPQRTPAQVRAMSVSDLNSLATRQLDWATSTALNTPAAAADLSAFQQILDFSREPNILATCGDMRIDDLMTAGIPAALTPLRAYSRGASSTRTTAWLRSTSNVATAVSWGTGLASLEAASHPLTLKLTMPQPDPIANPSAFEMLVNGSFIADFVNYLNVCHPVLSAEDGFEANSYVALRGEGVNPVSYHGSINFVRDYHHFTRAALDGLVRNEAVTTAQQQATATRHPVTLILHTTIDHNHAFHRSDGIAAVIVDPHILTIVIEGHPTLADYQAQIGVVAARYGIGGRISQVLIAGHGNFNVIGMAGTVTAGAPQQETLTNASTATATQVTNTKNLIQALVNVMSTNPANRRIALHACLTASHHVTGPFDPSPQTAAGQIQTAINADPNIRDFLQSLFGAGSTVLGVRASMAAQTFLDSNQRLILTAPQDPRLMGSRLDYIEFGTEPEGAMRAVLEQWAADQSVNPVATLARDAINRRLARPLGGATRLIWMEEVIRAIYDRVVNHYWSNASMINWYTWLAGFLGHLYWAGEGQAGSLWNAVRNLPAADVNAIFTTLSTSAAWTSQPRIRLIFNESWMRFAMVHGIDFLGELAGFATCGEAVRYIEMPNVVRPVIGSLLTIPPPAMPNGGQLRLALIEAAANPLPPDPAPEPVPLPPHVVFLRGLLGAGPNFPPALNIGGLTAGITNEDGILTAIRRSPTAPVTTTTGASLPQANVDLDRDGRNDFYLEPLAKTGTVANCVALNVRSRPWMGENVRDTIRVGATVRIVGRFHDWYGIEHRGRIRFVYNRYVQVPP